MMQVHERFIGVQRWVDVFARLRIRSDK